MPDDGIPEGIVTRTDIAELAALFDRFEFAFDPLSTAAKEAEVAFDDLILKLFRERVEPAFPRVAYAAFYCRIKSLCRTYLRKNAS